MDNKVQERPDSLTEDNLNKLATEMAKIIISYNKNSDLDDCIEISKEILNWPFDLDGFTLGKEFEKNGYDICALIVEDLDVIQYSYNDLMRDQIIEWVKENDVQLGLEVGTKIIFNSYSKNNETGEILKLYPETAQYGVWCESLNKPKETSHYVVNFEKIKDVVK
jgi:hypothetical protein